MARVTLLGTSAALSDAQHDYTHFLISGENGRSPILIDCGSNPLPKFPRLSIQFEDIQDIILTHAHADHIAGMPNFMTEMWLLRRANPLRLYGLDSCLRQVDAMLLACAWDQLPNPFQVDYVRVPEQDRAPVLENDDFRITAWLTKHFLPTIGLRIENKINGQVLAYSCDTEPVPGIIELAQNADILIHESAGKGPGHSSARQAGEAAAQANVGALYLIHYPPPTYQNIDGWISEAQSAYSGRVYLCQDYDTIEF